MSEFPPPVCLRVPVLILWLLVGSVFECDGVSLALNVTLVFECDGVVLELPVNFVF